MPFEVIPLQASEPILLSSRIFEDDRGYFLELYKKSDFAKMGIREDFVQDNISYSVKGVLRGLHYQMDPMAQGKLVTCLKGEVLDVMVDIRKGSPNYGKWRADVLSEKNGHMMYVPVGFAHGFLTLSKDAIFLYKCTKEYAPSTDRGIIWNDPEIDIDWGIENPILAPKDQEHPKLKNADNNFEYVNPYSDK
jgi:dTDP-4-dehydrorhamnose 3,5-epimerase